MRYRIKALAAAGAVEVFHVDAPDRVQAGRVARERGLSVVSIRADFSPRLGRRSAARRMAVGLLAQQLVALLAAGLSTVEALEAIAAETAGPGAATLQGALAQVRNGHSLSHALAQFPRDFSPLFVATVRASERSGDLKEALGRYVEYHTQIERLRAKVVSASIYPVLLAATGALVALFLMFYVVPKFGRIYDDIGSELPFMSGLLMRWGQFLSDNVVAVLAAIAAAAALVWSVLAKPSLRRWIWLRLWRIPSLGSILRIYHLSRFYRTLGMLLRSGMPLMTSLELAGDLLDPLLRPSLQAVRGAVNEGKAPSTAMSEHGLTTPMALSMLRVGEQTGELGVMMDRVAALYDDELSRGVDVATRLFEPLLMAAIGIVIGIIVVLLYLPIFELANHLQ